MKTPIAVLLVALAVVAAGAQEPVPNINANVDPTRPARLPSTFTGDPLQPTFPSGDNNPPSRGGTIGDGTELEDPQQVEATAGPEERRRRRAVPDGQSIAPTSELLLDPLTSPPASP